jgi:hypothetical protein
MENTFEVKPIANGGKGLFVNGLFAGTYSKMLGVIYQFSGNKNTIFDVEVCVEFLRSTEPNKPIYSYIKNCGNQRHLEVGFNKPIIYEGVITTH